LAGGPGQDTLGPELVGQYIATVLRALNELFPAGHGFTLHDSSGQLITSHLDSDADRSLFGHDTTFHDRVVLRPYQFEGHTVLLLFHFEDAENGRNTIVHVIDSGAGTLGFEQRQQLYESVQPMRVEDPELPRSFIWVFGPQANTSWQLDYFNVLNAWAILLGLRLNPHFAVGVGFSTEARQLFEATLNGCADWKLIWAFLRCHQYVLGGEPPMQNRRFTRTIGVEDVARHEQVLTSRDAPNADETSRTNFYPHLDEKLGVRHDMPFNEDSSRDEGHESPSKLPKPTPGPTPKQSEKKLDALPDAQKQNMESNLPKDFDPCSYFRQTRDRILSDRRARADLDDFREQERELCTTEYRKWLDDTEVALSIASVTMAITSIQDVTQGFAYYPVANVKMLLEGITDFGDDIGAVRPGRPLLLPLNVENHYVLIIIRIGEDGRPEFWVMDSKAYYLGLEGRRTVHDTLNRLLEHSHWQYFWTAAETDYHPRHTTWLPSAHQPSDDECGYYTILNAWSLALGLQPNPDAHPDWDDLFFRDLQDVLHLARIGRADWRLIYSFLRCRDFVREGYVPRDRQFEATTEVRNEEQINTVVDNMAVYDQVHQMEQGDLSWQGLRNVNTLDLPPEGRRHNDTAAFSSDRWNLEARHTAKELARKGKLDLSHSASQLDKIAKTARIDRGRQLHQQVGEMGIEYSPEDRDMVTFACRNYLQEWHDGHDGLLQAGPCEIAQDTIEFYRYLFAKDVFGNVFAGEAFRAWIDPDDKRNKKGRPQRPQWERAMDNAEVNLSLSAVVEAIDRLQREIHQDNFGESAVFAGGFTLSTSYNNDMALANLEYRGGVASHPRRCFLMPVCIGDILSNDLAAKRAQQGQPPLSRREGAGHHLLAAVQEEHDDEYWNFDVTFYDSSNNLFAESHHEFLAGAIWKALYKFRWANHRNPDNNIPPRYQTYQHLPQQAQGGGWRCGPHTVINGWILAMGLTPRTNDKNDDYPSVVYEEFSLIARAAVAGLLDWKTLIAWFFCRTLTVERNLSSVLPDRQFPMTRFWGSEPQLNDRIQEIFYRDDARLGNMPIDEAPYDHENNPRHGMLQASEAEAYEEEEEEDDDDVSEDEEPEEEEEDDEEEQYDGIDALTRGFEDPEPMFGGRRSRGIQNSTVPDILTFLDGWDVDSDGDVIMDGASRQAVISRGGGKDNLVFLDGF
jgi:hypothetical protein